jgi:2-methylcitrate dehydratase PrpD
MKWLPFEAPVGSFGAAQFVIKTSGAADFHCEVEYPRGEPENPVGDEVLVEKFRDCARGSLADSVANDLKDGLLRLEEWGNVADLTAMVA